MLFSSLDAKHGWKYKLDDHLYGRPHMFTSCFFYALRKGLELLKDSKLKYLIKLLGMVCCVQKSVVQSNCLCLHNLLPYCATMDLSLFW